MRREDRHIHVREGEVFAAEERPFSPGPHWMARTMCGRVVRTSQAAVVTSPWVSCPECLPKQEAAATRESAFAAARETGERVLIRRWVEPCYHMENGSIDIFSEYALPDGATKIHCQHTFQEEDQ